MLKIAFSKDSAKKKSTMSTKQKMIWQHMGVGCLGGGERKMWEINDI